MTNLEKKAIQHCIDQLGKISAHQIYVVVNDALNEEKIPAEKKTPILRLTSDATCNTVSEPLREIKNWLEALVK